MLCTRAELLSLAGFDLFDMFSELLQQISTKDNNVIKLKGLNKL